jgi:hypothetical protein
VADRESPEAEKAVDPARSGAGWRNRSGWASILEPARSGSMKATTAVAAEPVEPAVPTMRSAQQVAEEEGLTFAGTPGPGYSEGGDVYEPKESRPKAPLCM